MIPAKSKGILPFSTRPSDAATNPEMKCDRYLFQDPEKLRNRPANAWRLNVGTTSRPATAQKNATSKLSRNCAKKIAILN